MATEKRARRNREISVSKVRVIDQDGEQVGIRTLDDALDMAAEAGLDLVEVSPNADPPVCRIMDFGKYLFEQKKKAQEAKKKQTQTQLKEVKFRPTTEDADYQVKLRNATRFIEANDKVKVTLRFRGREMLHQDIGRKLLERVRDDLAEISQVEQFPKLEGRQMVMILSPKKKQS
ncbi:MAG: translation initiation factor IF-3 [Gammaproteobacteria bacterium]|nr:translation initiation factor IF-3 [Gammaproteobacteria bacterium]